MAKTAPHAHDNHNHQTCIKTAIAQAIEVCQAQGVRFTEQRRKILELVWQSHKPIGAYDILAEFSKKKQKAAPPTVYRALEFLLENGLIHRISSLNAYIGCAAPGHSHSGQFLLCVECKEVIELNEIKVDNVIQKSAEEYNFEIQNQMLEVTGLCENCKEPQ